VDDRWLRALAHDVVAVAQLLSRGIIRSRPLLVGLARVLPPDAVPNDTGNDPWLAACGPVEGYVSESNWNYLGAYLLCRALGVRSRSSAELAIHTFERVHTALGQRQMPDDGWRLLESRLPWNLFWLEWDRCRRVREAVGKLVVEHDFPLSMFDQLTNDHDLFAALVSDTASVSHGRAYLKFLRQAMKRDEQKYRDKIKIINRVL
jgi:hypothetical protein